MLLQISLWSAIRAAAEPDFAELLRPMLKALTYEDKIKSMMFIDVTSTFNVKQMTRYIEEMINHFQDKLLPSKDF